MHPIGNAPSTLREIFVGGAMLMGAPYMLRALLVDSAMLMGAPSK